MSKSQQERHYRTPMADECACDTWAGHRVLNIGRAHFGICDVCGHYWCLGSNLFSSWRHETEADWRRNYRERECLSECECEFDMTYSTADLIELREREYAEAAFGEQLGQAF
jgi:hypothetical protein